MPDHKHPFVPGQKWTVQACKYDHSPHITLPATLEVDDGDHLVFTMPRGTEFEHHTRGWKRLSQFENRFYFWRGSWFNIFVGYLPDGTLRSYYCNVALPLEIQEHTLLFVDLDIDLRLWPDGRCELLDMDEFRRNRVRYAYPRAVQRDAARAVRAIYARWCAGLPPFDQTLPP